MKVIIRITALLTIILAITSFSMGAIPHHTSVLQKIEKGEIDEPYYLRHREELRQRGVNAAWAAPELQLQRAMALTPPARTLGPAQEPTGDYKALVILVDFSDQVQQVEPTFFDSLVFSTIGVSVWDYYQDVSYGALDIVAVDLPSEVDTVHAPQTYAYYVNGQNGFGTYPQNAQKLVEDAVNAVDGLVDFSLYDNDDNGEVDALFIVHSGTGAELTGSSDDIWSHAWVTHYPYTVLDDVIISHYSMVPEYWDVDYDDVFDPGEDMTIGVYAHELGHAVFGLPDLYDYGEDSQGVGDWSLMAGGSWNGELGFGESPAFPDAWCHVQMNYINPINVESNDPGAVIAAVEDSAEVHRLWTNGNIGDEYFLIENRQQTGYDTYLPGNGLLIYHVDEAVDTDNDNQWYPTYTDSGHYLVALEQADGLWELEQNVDQGDSGDSYPGSTSNTTFDLSSTPNSRDYNGNDTYVAVANISASSALMTADFVMEQFFTVAPDSLWDDLIVDENGNGDSTVQTLTITNETTTDLDFTVSIQVKSATEAASAAQAVRQRHEQNIIYSSGSSGMQDGSTPEGLANEGIDYNSSVPAQAPLLSVMETSSSDEWVYYSSMTQVRGQHGVAVASDGRIYAFGGYDGSYDQSSLEIYDPLSDSWSNGASMPGSDRGMAFAVDDNGIIYSFGGVSSAGSYAYNPATNTWSSITAPPAPGAWEAGAARGPDGRIYLIGGEGSSSSDAMDDVQIYDPSTDSWTTGTPMPTPRYQHGVVAGPGGFIYAIGGRSSSSVLDVVEVYDPLTDTWSSATPMPTARNQFGVTMGADGRIYTIGGKTSYTNNIAPFFDVVEIYDPVSDTWETGPPLPVALGELEAVTAEGTIYAIGGTNGSYTALNLGMGTIGWLTVTPDAGTIAASSPQVLDVEFDPTGLISGDYDAYIVITGDNSTTQQVQIPAHMHVTGIPDIAVTPDTLTYDTLFVGYTDVNTVVVSNEGTDLLSIYDIASYVDEFWPDITAFDLSPGVSQPVVVTFDPQAAGMATGELTISSDDPDESSVSVVLQGVAVEVPVATVEPDSFEIALRPGQTATAIMTIGNEGNGDLTFSISAGGAPVTVAPLPVEQSSLAVADLAFSSENGRVTISDENKGMPVDLGAPAIGGPTMSAGGPDAFGYYYRDSNEPGGPAYSWVEISSSGTELSGLTGEDDAVLWSLTLPFAFPFYGAAYTELAISTNGTIFFEDGWMDLDNQPIPEENYDGVNRFIAHFWDDLVVDPGAIYYQLETDRAIIEFYQNRMYGGTDPGTWEVILYSNGNILFQYQDAFFSDSYDNYGASASIGIQGDANTGLQYSYYEASLENGLAILFSVGGGWLTFDPASGTVAPGEAVDVEVTFDATLLSEGQYENAIAVVTNDPEKSEVIVPVRMRVLPEPGDPPVITAIVDVPEDQGGWVTASWQAAPDDSYFSDDPVAAYSVWMWNPESPQTVAGAASKPVGTTDSDQSAEAGLSNQQPESADGPEQTGEITLPPALIDFLSEDGEWIGIGSIWATQDTTYSFLVGPTPQDSNQTGTNWTYLRVSAHGADPYDYSISEVDSGYSVDNLPPEVPADLAAAPGQTGIELSWSYYDPEVVPDLQYFAIYRGLTDNFEPDHSDTTYYSEETVFVDEALEIGVWYYYRVAAVDYNGNYSDPTDPVSFHYLSVVEGTVLPEAFALRQNYPNPFNPNTTIMFEVPEATSLSLIIYDILGRELVHLHEGYAEPGYHQLVWNGMTDSGVEAPTGIYILRMTTPGYTGQVKMVLMK